MFVSGFTIVRNAIKFGYPVKESILSILPVVDEMVVLVGQSEDGTEDLVRAIALELPPAESSKLKVHHSIWDDSLRDGGQVLAVETNKALGMISPDADWAFYIQADECLHEKHHAAVRDAMTKHLHNEKVEGLLFAYRHFYGSYDYVATSRDFYRNEIRIVRNDPAISSYRDAQGFRKDGEKLKVARTGAEIYHYGWVRNPQVMSAKIKNFHRYWHSDEWIEVKKELDAAYDYSAIDSVQRFTGTHPAVMKNRVSEKNWDIKLDEPDRAARSFVRSLLGFIEQQTGYRIGEYKNYILLK
jgi:hypothetical protein